MKKSIRFWLVYTVAATCALSAHVASAWTFFSDVDSDSSKWSRYNTYYIDSAGADRYTNNLDNTFVRVWAYKDYFSSAGRTVSIPSLTFGICAVQITHTGAAGSFYVRDSATYTNLSPVVSVSQSFLAWDHNENSLLNKVNTSFSARNKKIFARFYMPGGDVIRTGLFGSHNPATAYIDDLKLSCI